MRKGWICLGFELGWGWVAVLWIGELPVCVVHLSFLFSSMLPFSLVFADRQK